MTDLTEREKQIVALEAKLAVAREALIEIGRQPYEYQMDEWTRENADYLDGYECCIETARQALKELDND